jgi:hypothetical protein
MVLINLLKRFEEKKINYFQIKKLKDTQKFKTVEIILKLDKVYKTKREIIIMSEENKK